MRPYGERPSKALSGLAMTDRRLFAAAFFAVFYDFSRYETARFLKKHASSRAQFAVCIRMSSLYVSGSELTELEKPTGRRTPYRRVPVLKVTTGIYAAGMKVHALRAGRQGKTAAVSREASIK